MLLKASKHEAREPKDEGQVATKALEDFIKWNSSVTVHVFGLRLDELQCERLEFEPTACGWV